MSAIPEFGFLREKQILGDKKANPPIAGILPISRSSWWRGIDAGKYPRPVHLGPRTIAWPAAAIRQLLADLEGTPQSPAVPQKNPAPGVPARSAAKGQTCTRNIQQTPAPA